MSKKPGTRTAKTARQKEEDFVARFRRMPKPVRIVYARPRLFISILLGLASLIFMPESWRLTSRLLLGWDICLLLYLVLAFTTVISCGSDHIRRQAAWQDDGRFFILILTSVAAFASIAAIVLELGAAHKQPAPLALAVTTIVFSWAAIHTTFALHYAHEYYRGEKAGGLDFPGGGDPDYWDFIYFSFVIGMTAQTSDTGITDRIIRRTATAHGAAKIDTTATSTAGLLADRAAVEAAARKTDNVELDHLRFVSPVTRPCRVIAQMTNFESHVKDAGMDPSSVPLTFFRKASASMTRKIPIDARARLSRPESS